MKSKASKTKAAKPTIRVSDLKPGKNPKGGAEFVIVKHVDKSSPVFFP